MSGALSIFHNIVTHLEKRGRVKVKMPLYWWKSDIMIYSAGLNVLSETKEEEEKASR